MSKEVRFYRPNKDISKGSAVSIQVVEKAKGEKYKEWNMFLTLTKQTGVDDNNNAEFAWKDDTKTITIKMGPEDVTDILAVLEGKKEKISTTRDGDGRFHQNAKGNTVLKFAPGKMGGGSYYIGASSKLKTGETKSVSQLISITDAITIDIVFREFIRMLYLG
jgi:hypothetical protein